MIKDILKKASEMDASDVHLNTYNPPAFRIDGEIQRIGDEPLTAESIMECINTVTNDLEKEMYKKGEDIDSSYEDEDGNRFRINIFTQRKSPAMVVRLLNTHIPTLEEYNLPRVLAELAELPRGMVLVTGPTGSGKRLRVDTPIKTPTGMVSIGELKIGDQVYDSKNKVCNVTDVSEIEEKPELYALEFTDGQVVYADAEHQWIVSTRDTRNWLHHHKTQKKLYNNFNGISAGKKMLHIAKYYDGVETFEGLLQIIKDNGLDEYIKTTSKVRGVLIEHEVKKVDNKEPHRFNISDFLIAAGRSTIRKYEYVLRDELKVYTTREMIDEGITCKAGHKNFAIPILKNDVTEDYDVKLPLDPYTLGVWLGDGSSYRNSIASGEGDYEELIKHLEETIDEKYTLTYDLKDTNIGNKVADIKIKTKSDIYNAHNGFTRDLRELGLYGNKHIPYEYLVSSYNQRLELLRGLIDTDGSVDREGRGVSVGFSNERLASDTAKLIRSLGFRATVRKKPGVYTCKKTGKRILCKDTYSINFNASSDVPIAKLLRKAERQTSFINPRHNWNYIASITKVDENSEEYGPARCISVDSDDHSYQCADGIITHNSTTLAAMINHINMNKKKHILTLEDPIEYIHEQKQSILNQREIHKDSKSFDDSLKSALREDPDIILIGEMRDIETIKLAITAAETGHLVLSTLHTIGAPDTINRIIDTFPADQQSQVRAQLSMSLKGVVSQVLIPKVGGGRIAAHEILISNDAIANNIRQNAIQNISSSMLSGKGQGMQLLDHKLAELVREGKIERDKAKEFVKDKEQFDRLMR